MVQGLSDDRPQLSKALVTVLCELAGAEGVEESAS
jgi:hypothetical protein